MIPDKKKTPEEIAALRDDLGIPVPTGEVPTPSSPQPDPTPDESVIHLDIPINPKVAKDPKTHRLRKYDQPLAPASIAGYKTALPDRRHGQDDIAQIRKREALSQLEVSGQDPAARLRAQTASPFLYGPGYLLAVAAAVAAHQRVHHMTPASLLALSLLITIFIALRKPRSRHHAALIFIVVFLTTALGAIHYAPLFQYGP